MRKVVLFIAISLDGYIADKNGQVDWLNGEDKNIETEDTYSTFIQNVDTVIMGWNTYHQIVTELSPDEWVYKGLKSYVLTHRNLNSTSEITYTDKSPNKLIHELKKQQGKDIWICGGANLIHQLMNDNLIDEYIISIIPTLLGSGIKLFQENEHKILLKLIKTQSSNGIVELTYQRQN